MNRPPTPAARSRPSPLKGNPRHTREEHSQEIALDYVELISELIATMGEARVTELARRLGVTHVTVNRTISRLQRDGLVSARPYRSILLTEAGRKLSEKSRRRHEIVVEFLKSLGVPDAIAHLDAEGMEHHVSRQTLNAFVNHLQRRRWRPYSVCQEQFPDR
jgi:DtxR family manganese transport transcriptional regulator